MSLLALIGLGLYLAGHGVSKLPSTGVVGGIVMFMGGVLFIVAALV